MNTNQQEEQATSSGPMLTLKIDLVDELYQVDTEVNGGNGRALVLGLQNAQGFMETPQRQPTKALQED